MSEPQQPSPARSRRLKAAAIAILILAAASDLASKAWFEDYLGMDPDPSRHRPAARRVEVIPGFFAWEGTYNPGITFGLAAGQTRPILALTGLATLGLFLWLLATSSRSRTLHVGLGLIVGGALGNLYDRYEWSKVRDFILVYFGEPGSESFKWPNFNLADSFIVVGVGFVLFDALFGWGAKEARREMEARKAARQGTAP